MSNQSATGSEYANDISEKTLNDIRLVIQRFLIPCIVSIGIAGNLLTVVVLTRRRMRCSTNIYLTALAVADIVNLLFVFILSLKHYPNARSARYKLYWSFFGLSHWFHDASLYTSIYLTVSFTLERYISVCHPLRGQVLCTESRAKRVIFAVVVLCFLLTMTTPFEYKMRVVDQIHCQNVSNVSQCTNESIVEVLDSDLGQHQLYKQVFYIFTDVTFKFLPLIMLTVLNYFLIMTVRRSHRMRNTMTNTRQQNTDSAQENKVTITLIAVVILFLVCQTPSAIQLLWTIDYDKGDHKSPNLILAINNFFNLLVNLNAATNFILYCALSDKYRKTVKAIFCGMKPMRKNTISSSRFTSGRTTTSSFYSRSHKSSFFDRPRFRPKEPKRFSISKEEYENLKAETEMLKRPPPRLVSPSSTSKQSRTNSISTDDTAVTEVITEGIPMNTFPMTTTNAHVIAQQQQQQQQQKVRKNRLKNIRLSFAPPDNNNHNVKVNPDVIQPPSETETIVETPPTADVMDGASSSSLNTQPNAQPNHQHTADWLLQPSPSETSLTRSRSLTLPPKTKHSPDCKDNPVKFD